MTESIAALQWQHPWWLLGTLFPVMLMIWPHDRHRLYERLQSYAEPRLLPRLLTGNPGTWRQRSLAFSIAWLLAMLALAGPYWKTNNTEAPMRRGIDIAVIVDISPSMLTQDIAPDRLHRAKLELRDMARLRPHDRLGLIAFSANAYTVLPLTYDKESFLHYADGLDPTLVKRQGSHAERAMELAERMLVHTPKGSGAVLLISDGEFHNDEISRLSAILRKAAIPLYVIGMGTPQGGPVPDARGRFMRHENHAVISRLDRTGLMTLAENTRGHYTDVREDDSDWMQIGAALDRLQPARQQHADNTSSHDTRATSWLLALSLGLFMWVGMRRHAGLATAVLSLPAALLLGHAPPADAAPWTEQQAYEALLQGDYDSATHLYDKTGSFSGLTGLGISKYRQQRWQEAYTAFKRSSAQARTPEERALAAYNTGNALTRLSRYEEASRAYQAALQARGNYPHAALNLSLINKFLDSRRNMNELQLNNEAAASKQAGALSDKTGKTTIKSAKKVLEPAQSDPTTSPGSLEAQYRPGGVEGNIQELLRRRFYQQDKSATIIEDKPW